MEDQAYEFVSQAFIIFEEDITETEARISALNLIVTTLYSLTCFGTENYDTLTTNAVGYSGKLLKKNLQAEAINLSAHLYFSASKRDGKKMMDQLKKALKTSEICMNKPENLYLLVKILNSYLYFYQSSENMFVQASDINDLLSYIKETIEEMEDRTPAEPSIRFLENTKEAITDKGKNQGIDKMADITI